MSYILEALKKAQAERQLGETPTIHAPTLETPATGGSAVRKPLVGIVVAMGVVIAGLAAVLWRQMAQPEAAPQVAAAPAPVVRAVTPAPAPAPVAAVAPPAAPVPPPAAPVAPPAKPAVAQTAPAPAPAPAAPPAPAEEPVQGLRDLPEPIQRAIPPIAMSGYMYSANPADRLILIDKVLRHEGEEVAPGLVLTRLEAKGAVFTFRGYRYRVPY